ncbi:hypothetical protein PT2222_110233 [Paraburkholderia tropica]
MRADRARYCGFAGADCGNSGSATGNPRQTRRTRVCPGNRSWRSARRRRASAKVSARRDGSWAFAEEAAFGEFTLFADVEGGNRSVITHDARPDLAARAFFFFQDRLRRCCVKRWELLLEHNASLRR